MQSAVPAFRGLENRFTVVDAGGVRIIKDYISHPTGIRRVIRGRKSGRSTHHRGVQTLPVHDDQLSARRLRRGLPRRLETVITELYTAGEVPIPGIDTEFLCDKIRSRGPKVTYIQSMDDIIPYLHKAATPGEQVIFFGGDDLFQLADRYAEGLQRGHLSVRVSERRFSVVGAGRSGLAAANALAALGADVLLVDGADKPRPGALDERVAYRSGSAFAPGTPRCSARAFQRCHRCVAR